MRKPQRLTAVPAAPAIIDAGVLVRSRILEVLRAKAEEVAQGGRFEDRSYVDDAGRHHARGGFWNSDAPSVGDGYGKGDVEDVLRQLRQYGIRLDYEDADGFLSQLVRTGALDDVEVIVSLQNRPLTMRLDLDLAMPKPREPLEARVGNLVLVEQNPNAYVVRPAGATNLASTHIVLLQSHVPMCTCRLADCTHVAAVLQHRGAATQISSLKALRLSDPEHSAIVRTLIDILAARGLYAPPSKRDKGGQPRNTAQCALQLLLRALFGATYQTHVDTVALVQLGLLDRPAGSTTLERYRAHADVLTLLSQIRHVASRGVRARGVTVPMLRTIDNLRGDQIAAEIVHMLRLDGRVTTLDVPEEDEVLEWY